LASSSNSGNASSGASSMNGKAASGGGTSGNGSAVGQVSSPFLDTKTVTSGTSEGSGESNSSIDVADPAVAPGTIRTEPWATTLFSLPTRKAAQTGSLTVVALYLWIFQGGGSSTGMGLTTMAKPVAFNGEGLGVAMTINGIAVKEVEQSGSAFSSGQSSTGALPAPVVPPLRFSNEGSGFFGQAPPASAA
jgi:hypothetical protein